MSDRYHRTFSAARTVALAATIAGPPIGILTLILTLGVNVPFQDDWDTSYVVWNWMTGSLHVRDFWQQYAEHRIAAVQLLLWPIGTLSHYNVVVEMLVGFACVVLTLAVVHQILQRALQQDAPELTAPMTGVASLLLFSLVFHETWFFGLASLQLFLLDLAAVVVIWALAVKRSWAAYALAAGAATVGSFTHATGLLLWGTGAIALWFRRRERTMPAVALAIWSGMAAVTLAAYTWRLDWDALPSRPGLTNLLRFGTYALTSLGTPFAYGGSAGFSLTLGSIAVMLLVTGAEIIFERRSDLIARLLPVALLVLQGAMTVGLVAFGRSKVDASYAMVSHLVFGPTFFWLGTLVLVATALRTAPPETILAQCLRWALGCSTLILLCATFGSANVAAFQRAYARSRNLEMAKAMLDSPSLPLSVSALLYPPDDARLAKRIREFKSVGLGPFADATAASHRGKSIFSPEDGSGHEDGLLEGGTCGQLYGWAWDPTRPDVPIRVEIWRGDTRVGTEAANWFRTDLRLAGIGNGQHAFFFVFDRPMDRNTGAALTVKIAGTSRPLRGSPKTVVCR